jgi:hypothetical protein
MNPALIAVAVDGLVKLISVVQNLREQARKDKVLTREEDIEFDARIQAAFRAPHWQLSNLPDTSGNSPT